MRISVFLLTLLLMPTAVFAYSPKEGNVSATLGMLAYRTNFESSPSGAVAPVQFNFALVVSGDINDRGALEIGVYHMTKQYFRDLNSYFVGQEIETIEITMGYRQWITPSISASIAFSSAYSLGYIRTIHDDFVPNPPIDTSAGDNVEYGFHFSAQADLFTIGRFTGSLSALYSLSVTAKPNERADHYGALVGLRYFIQEKQVGDQPHNKLK